MKFKTYKAIESICIKHDRKGRTLMLQTERNKLAERHAVADCEDICNLFGHQRSITNY